MMSYDEAGMEEALSFITNYEGKTEFGYGRFEKACLDAMKVVQEKELSEERLVACIISFKLQGEAIARFRTNIFSFKTVSEFLQTAREVFLLCPEHLHDADHWKNEIVELRQHPLESIRDYGQRAQKLLREAKAAVSCEKYNSLRFFDMNVRLKKIIVAENCRDLDMTASTYFWENTIGWTMRFKMRMFATADDLEENINRAIKLEEQLKFSHDYCEFCLNPKINHIIKECSGRDVLSFDQKACSTPIKEKKAWLYPMLERIQLLDLDSDTKSDCSD